MKDYERKYKQALIRATREFDCAQTDSTKNVIQTIFPELLESEDERIRKWCISHFRECFRVSKDNVEYQEYLNNKVIPWLEKQGEQKSIIFNNAHVIDSALNDYCCKQYNALHKENGGVLSFARLQHLAMDIYSWFEKQGNRAENKEFPASEKRDFGYFNESTDKVEPKFNVGDWVVWDNKISCHIDNIYQGKESLMYTITDVHNMTRSCSVKGFDNNAHLWTIQDAKDGDVLATLDYILIFKEFLKNDGGISYCHYDFGAGNPQFIWSEDKNWYFGKEAIIHPATKEQRDILFAKMKEAGYEWDADKKELKKIEQMSSWSEEDEQYLLVCKNALAKYQITDKWDASIISRWLESLKDRVQTQPKQEWSEEDKKMLDSIFISINEESIAEALRSRGDSYSIEDLTTIRSKQINWLKSLRPHSHWKPTGE